MSEIATFVGRTFAVSNVNMREMSALTASTVVREAVCRSNELCHTPAGVSSGLRVIQRKPLRFKALICTVVPPSVTLSFSSGNWRIKNKIIGSLISFYILGVNLCGIVFNPLNTELNSICYLLALLAHHFLHVSRIRVKSLTLRLLMSYIYIYGAPILDVSRSHTTTQHSR